MPNKEYRQRLITEIVETHFIATQADLAEHLRKHGIQVTQATISRDISELRLVRLPDGNKNQQQHRYRAMPLTDTEDTKEELRQRFELFVQYIDLGENIIIIKVDEGHASGVAYVIDKLKHDDIVGTLAGQDSILVVGRTTEAALSLLDEFEALMPA